VKDSDRDPTVLLQENAAAMSLLATRRLYAEQPELWRLGEYGRARTLEDFGHHFAALARLDDRAFEAHVRYCYGLFGARGFPPRWLADAWRHMEPVLRSQLPPHAAEPAIALLLKTTSAGGTAALPPEEV
jgi:hypothetical protein